MTKHRIPADKVVIEDDRRKEQRVFISGWLKRDGECEAIIEERQSEQDYSQPHKFFYVLVEPAPLWEEEPTFSKGKEYDAWYGRYHTKDSVEVDAAVSPFNPDDTLILLEEWERPAIINGRYDLRIRKSNWKPLNEHDQIEYTEWSPAETMPDDIGQQFTVVKVLGAEKIDPASWAEWDDGLPCPRQEWHWKLLSKEKGEGA